MSGLVRSFVLLALIVALPSYSATFQVVQTLKDHTDSVRDVTFLQDETMVSGGNDGRILHWVKDGTWSAKFIMEPGDIIYSLTPGADESYFVAGLYNFFEGDNNSTTHYLRSDFSELRSLGNGSFIRDTAFTHDGELWAIMTGSNLDEIEIFDTATWTVQRGLDNNSGVIRDLSFSPDDEYLSSCGEDGRIVIYETSTWDVVANITEHTDWVTLCEFTPDGKYLISGSRDEQMFVWNVPEFTLNTEVISAVQGEVTDVAFNANLMATAGSSTGIILWDMNSWTQTSEIDLSNEAIWSVDFRNGILVAGAKDSNIYVIEDIPPPEILDIPWRIIGISASVLVLVAILATIIHMARMKVPPGKRRWIIFGKKKPLPKKKDPKAGAAWLPAGAHQTAKRVTREGISALYPTYESQDPMPYSYESVDHEFVQMSQTEMYPGQQLSGDDYEQQDVVPTHTEEYVNSQTEALPIPPPPPQATEGSANSLAIRNTRDSYYTSAENALRRSDPGFGIWGRAQIRKVGPPPPCE